MMMILIDWIDMTHNTQHHFLLLESYFVSFLSFFPQIIFFLSFFQFFHVSCLYESLSMSIANSIGTSYRGQLKFLRSTFVAGFATTLVGLLGEQDGMNIR